MCASLTPSSRKPPPNVEFHKFTKIDKNIKHTFSCNNFREVDALRITLVNELPPVSTYLDWGYRSPPGFGLVQVQAVGTLVWYAHTLPKSWKRTLKTILKPYRYVCTSKVKGRLYTLCVPFVFVFKSTQIRSRVQSIKPEKLCLP